MTKLNYVLTFLYLPFVCAQAGTTSIEGNKQMNQMYDSLEWLSNQMVEDCDRELEILQITMSGDGTVDVVGYPHLSSEKILSERYLVSHLQKNTTLKCINDELTNATKPKIPLATNEMIGFMLKKWNESHCNEVIEEFFYNRAAAFPERAVVIGISKRKNSLDFTIAARRVVHFKYTCPETE